MCEFDPNLDHRTQMAHSINTQWYYRVYCWHHVNGLNENEVQHSTSMHLLVSLAMLHYWPNLTDFVVDKQAHRYTDKSLVLCHSSAVECDILYGCRENICPSHIQSILDNVWLLAGNRRSGTLGHVSLCPMMPLTIGNLALRMNGLCPDSIN